MEEERVEKPTTQKRVSRRGFLGGVAAVGAARLLPDIPLEEEQEGKPITPPIIYGSVVQIPLEQVLNGQYRKPEPINGFLVALSKMKKTDTGSESIGDPVLTKTDENGGYIFEGVEPGFYQVGHGHIDTAKDNSILLLGPQFGDYIEITVQTRKVPGPIFIRDKKEGISPQTIPNTDKI